MSLFQQLPRLGAAFQEAFQHLRVALEKRGEILERAHRVAAQVMLDPLYVPLLCFAIEFEQ